MTSSEWTVDASTRMCAVIGDPVAHSLSPTMHNAAFRASGLSLALLAFCVKRDRLRSLVDGFRAANILGFSVTTPHKVAIIKLLDEIEETARRVGAVNSVVNRSNKLIGFNTDVEGAMEPLAKRDLKSGKDMAVLIGAGGAARACLLALERLGFRDIAILNRSAKRAEDMAKEIGRGTRMKLTVMELSETEVVEATSSASVLVNATSIGMSGEKVPVPRKAFRQGMVVFDVEYTPVKTPFLRMAETQGSIVVPGYEMLVSQGERSFKIWTGRDPPRGVMRKAVLRALGEKL